MEEKVSEKKDKETYHNTKQVIQIALTWISKRNMFLHIQVVQRVGYHVLNFVNLAEQKQIGKRMIGAKFWLKIQAI